MGLIAKFTPGSIRDADDMVRALEIVLIDLFDGVGGSMERDGDTIRFVVDGAGGSAGFAVEITVKKSESPR